MRDSAMTSRDGFKIVTPPRIELDSAHHWSPQASPPNAGQTSRYPPRILRAIPHGGRLRADTAESTNKAPWPSLDLLRYAFFYAICRRIAGA
jgi:hypothetical protein